MDETLGDWLLTNRKQIAVITYTNAACDEISRRLHYKSIFSVSTIHSFLWELIKNYQSDIIAYTYDCEAVKATAMKNNWFEDDEIRLLE